MINTAREVFFTDTPEFSPATGVSIAPVNVRVSRDYSAPGPQYTIDLYPGLASASCGWERVPTIKAVMDDFGDLVMVGQFAEL